MHELSLANSVFDLIENECSRIGRWNLKEVQIEIGELAGVELESFKFCLENIKRESRYETMQFVYINVPCKAFCMMCGNNFEAHHRYPQCPICGSSQVAITHGLEFKVKSLVF